MNLLIDIMKKNIPFCVPQTRTPDMLYLMKKYDYEDLLVVNIMHNLNLVGIVHPLDLKAELENELQQYE